MTGVALLFTALTVLLTYPLSFHLTTRVLSNVPDTWLMMWSLVWDTHAFTHRPWAIFDANMYYPLHDTLAFSENFIGSAVFAAPVIWLTSNPVLALNLVSMVTVVLCGLGAYRLARICGVSVPGAVVCGIVFAFSPPRFLRISQLHLAAMQWMPFALASLFAYFDGGRRRDLRWAAVLAAAQALTSGYGAVFLVIAVVLLVAYRIVRGAPLRIAAWPRDLGIVGVLALVPGLLAFVPYLIVQRDFGFKRGLGGWFGTPAAGFLASPSHVQTWFLSTFFAGARINETAEAFLFPGFLPIALAACALVPRWRRPAVARVIAVALDLLVLGALGCAIAFAVSGPVRVRVGDLVLLSVKSAGRAWAIVAVGVAARAAMLRRATLTGPRWLRLGPGANGAVGYFALLTGVSVWLMVGPPFSLWPHVYSLPAFNFIRMPSRFVLLGILGLAVLAGFGFDRLASVLVSDTYTDRLNPRPVSDTYSRGLKVAAIAIGAAMVTEFACIPLWTDPLTPTIPAADRWLASQPTPFVVAEVPVPPPRRLGASERRQTLFMFHSTAHWQKTVHGYSGFRLQLHTDLYDTMTQFPDPSSLDALEALGVTYVVMHLDLYDPGERDDALQRAARFGDRLRLVYADGEGRVYALTNASARTG